MLTVLLESRATRQGKFGSTVASAVLHGAILAAAVALTLPGRRSATPTAVQADTIIYLVQPPPREEIGPPSTGEAVTPLPRPGILTIDPPPITPVDLSTVTGPELALEKIRIGGPRGGAGTGPSMPGTSLGSGGIADVTAVDRAPRTIGRLIEPRYPDQLRAAGIEGTVIAEFVVDTTGHAELPGLRFPVSANPLFNEPVRAALARYRFVAGEIAGRKVRTRVQMPFEFRLTP